MSARVRRSGEVRVALPPDRVHHRGHGLGDPRAHAADRLLCAGPGVSAGAVSVALRPDGEHTLAEVTYELTSLGADEELERFADGFDLGAPDRRGGWLAQATIRVASLPGGRLPGDAQ